MSNLLFAAVAALVLAATAAKADYGPAEAGHIGTMPAPVLRDYGAPKEPESPYAGPPEFLKHVEVIDVVNYTALLGAYALIIWDCQWSSDNISSWQWQTYPAVLNKNPTPYHAHYEHDPIVVWMFGKNPTSEQFFIAGAMSATVTTLVFAALPRKWKWAAPTVVALAEGWTMAGNLKAVSLATKFSF